MAVRASRVRRSAGTIKPPSWGTQFPGRGGDTGKAAFQINMVNLNEYLKEIEEYWREAKEDAVEALRESLEKRVMVPSRRLCPVATGALRESAWADADYAGGHIRGSVGYDTDYALYVHEILAYHKVGQWKFLEEPFNENAQQVAEDVLNAVVEAW